MKKPTIFLITALIALTTASAAIAQIRYVAIVEAEVNEQSGAAAKLNRAEVQEITAVLRNEARNTLPSGKYKIMTAETVIAQGGAVLEECAEENCVISLGNKIGADYIVRGTLSKFGTELTLSVVMYETEDGTLVASARVSSEKPKELLEKTVAACGVMYKTFLNEIGGGAQKGAAAQTAQTPPPQPAYQSPTPAPPPQSAQPVVAATPKPAYQPPAQTYQTPTPAPTTTGVAKQPVNNATTPTLSYSRTIPFAKQSVNQNAAPTYRQSQGLGIFTDNRDGKKYSTAVIGGKRWIGENLNHQPSSGSWCYNNDNSYCDKYGRLYDWNTAKTVCPTGWHLPSRQEWNNLADTVGGNSAAGKKLKAKNGWNERGNGTDNFGFWALPGGYRYSGGSFGNVDNYGNWWTATEGSDGYAYSRSMNGHSDGVNENYDGKSYAFSVRCVED